MATVERMAKVERMATVESLSVKTGENKVATVENWLQSKEWLQSIVNMIESIVYWYVRVMLGTARSRFSWS